MYDMDRQPNMKSIQMRKLISLLFLSIGVLHMNYAQTIHVNGNSDQTTQDGSTSEPFITIQQAVDNAQPGDVIIIHEGIYREEVEIPVDSITIKAAPGEKVTISGVEPVLNWIPIGDEVYMAIVPWDVTEGNQSNQVFIDGEMMHLARWPKQTHPDFVTEPVYAIMDNVKESGISAILVTENEFDQPKERWLNAKAWLNFSHNNHDGQGWSGTVSYVSTITNTIKIVDEGGLTNLHVGEGNFKIGRGTEFYLFGPDSTGVYSSGGPRALLARGEWWKNADTLFVRLPDGGVPASVNDSVNLIEVKKRVWAFKPAPDGPNRSGLEIADLNIFAASILTDLNYYTRGSGILAEDAINNVFRNLRFDYITHFIDNNAHMSGHLWFQRSGFILGGINSSILNCTFNYSAGSAISAYGQGHRIIGNKIYDVNYHVLESGAINGGNGLQDPEIAHNFIYNSPLTGILLDQVTSSEPSVVGKSRIHHNLINRFMLLGHDGGAINASAGRDWQNVRVDHNVIMNGTRFLSVGIYFDFGGNTVIDHNVVFNTWSPMSLNRWETPLGTHQVYNNTLFASAITTPGFQSSFRDGDGELMTAKNNLASGTWFSGTFDKGIAENNVFVNSGTVLESLVQDYTNKNFLPRASALVLIDQGSDVAPFNDTIVGLAPDIGAYEYGAEPWLAGPEGVISDIELSYGPTNLNLGDTLKIQIKVFKNGFIQANPLPNLEWFVNEGVRFIDEGLFVADSETPLAYIRVSDNNLLKKYIQFSVEDNSTAIEDEKVSSNSSFEIELFPNPASDYLQLVSNRNVSNYEIIDFKGSVLHRMKNENNVRNNLAIDVSMLGTGIYFIRVSTGSEVKVMRFVKF